MVKRPYYLWQNERSFDKYERRLRGLMGSISLPSNAEWSFCITFLILKT